MKTVLYIEEKPHVRKNFVKLFTGLIDFLNIVTVDTVSNGIDLIDRMGVDLVITGRQVTPKEVNLLDNSLRKYPDIKLIAMAERKSQLSSLLKAFEYKIQFEMPVDIPLLLETLLSEFEVNYGGQIRGINLTSFLQMIELEGMTCLLKVYSKNQKGFLYCDNGDLIAAEIDQLSGKDAVFAILDLENPLISIDYDLPTKEKTIDESLIRLLLESGRTKDEKELKPHERRRYKRFPCSIPVEFEYNEWSYKAVVSDISLSGIFMQTESPFSVGDEIDIAFFSQTLEKGCRIPGIVVRRAADGIGVELQQMSINQMAILRTIINEVVEP